MLTMSFRPLVLALLLAIPALPLTATPSQALCIFFCGGYGGDDDEDETPEVTATGIIHPVYIVGETFFPDTLHVAEGDEVKFYNLRNSSIRVEADSSGYGSNRTDGWTSDRLYKNESWSVLVYDGLSLDFEDKYDSHMKGEIKIEATPDSVDFGELIDADGNIIGKDGAVTGVATGLGYTLAGVGGVVQDVGDGVGDLVGGLLGGSNGNGNANGLTDDYGNGNND